MPDRPVIIAHRGASGYLPEHTLAAKALAHAQGADFLEQDVVLTRDQIPVVLHDIQLDTVTNVAAQFPDRRRDDGRFYAGDLLLTELQTLTVHERTDLATGQPVFAGRFPAGVGGGRIPTLAEELDFIAGLNQTTGRTVGIYPEIKQPAWHRQQGVEITPLVLAVINQHWLDQSRGPCVIQCFDYAELVFLRTIAKTRAHLVYLVESESPAYPDWPDLRTAQGWAEVAAIADGLGPALACVLDLQGGPSAITPFVRSAHDAGLLVHPWTARADALPPGFTTIDELLQTLFQVARVDGVFIDQPDRGVAAARADRSGSHCAG